MIPVLEAKGSAAPLLPSPIFGRRDLLEGKEQQARDISLNQPKKTTTGHPSSL